MKRKLKYLISSLIILAVVIISLIIWGIANSSNNTPNRNSTTGSNSTTPSSSTTPSNPTKPTNPTEPSSPAGDSKPKPSRDQVLTIGDHVLSAEELNYFYIDAINTYCNQYSYYISYIIDTKSPLNSESNTDSNGVTWADKFLDMAMANIKSTYQLYDLAMKHDFKLSDAQQAEIDTLMSSLDDYAKYYGFFDADAYLCNMYGSGANTESYRAYYEICTIADAYYDAYADALKYDDADLRAYEADKAAHYNSYSYSYYYFRCNAFLTGGTKLDDGTVYYTDDEKKAAVETARELANQLAAQKYDSRDSFDSAIYSLLNNHFGNYSDLYASGFTLASTKKDNVLYERISALYCQWLTSAERCEGDLFVIADQSSANGTVNGYYVIRFEGVSDNAFNMKNVRHLLAAFEGGTTDSHGNTTYTDAEKAAAKYRAMKLLQQFEQGGKTEAFFIQMANEYSDDGDGTTGGLYINIYPGQMVTSFEDWCYSAERKPGDYGLIESEYGWHLMYFVGDSEITYRDYMIENDLRNEELTNWIDRLLEEADFELLTKKYVDMDLVLD